jgi:hypothetical protein
VVQENFIEEISNMRYRTCAVFLSIAVSACVGASNQDPAGDITEPITLKGRIVTDDNFVLPNADLLLVWPDARADKKGNIITTARAAVAAEGSHSFTMTVPGPPPDAAFSSGAGNRVAHASFVLVEAGTEIQGLLDPGSINSIENHLLTFATADGWLAVREDDGPGSRVALSKGYTLVSEERIECADGYDQSCIDRLVGMGTTPSFAKRFCAINSKSIANAFRASTDSEVVMTVRDPHGPQPDLVIPCP